MNKKKILAIILASVCTVSMFTSCSGEKKESAKPTATLTIDTDGETMATKEPEAQTPAPTQSPTNYGGNPNGDEVGDDVYIGSVKIFPDIPETNPGVYFGVISQNEEAPIDVFNNTLLSLKKEYNLIWSAEGFDEGSKEISTFGQKLFVEHNGDFFFYAPLVDQHIFAEVAEDNYLMKPSTLIAEKQRYNRAVIKGFCAYKEYINPDMYTYSFYAGINFDMTRSDIESILGEGIEGTPYSEETRAYLEREDIVHNFTPIMYRGGDTAFVVCYENDAPMRFFVLKR